MRADARMSSWLSSFRTDDRIVTCTIARGEILFGIRKLARGRRRSEFESKAQKLFSELPCEPIPPDAGDHYANVKLAQQRRGLSLDENDLWIAATTLAIGATLVSYDSDFLRIDALTVIAP